MNRLFIIIGIVLAVLGGGYFLYSNSAPTAPTTTLVTTGALGATGQAKGTVFDFAKALLNINTIKLDATELEANKAWVSLEDHTTNLRSPQKGRRNPFAPIERDFAASLSASVPQAAATSSR